VGSLETSCLAGLPSICKVDMYSALRFLIRKQTLKSRMSGRRLSRHLLVGPYWRYQVDDEQIVGIEEKSHTADCIELEITSGHHTRHASQLCCLFTVILLLCRGSEMATDV